MRRPLFIVLALVLVAAVPAWAEQLVIIQGVPVLVRPGRLGQKAMPQLPGNIQPGRDAIARAAEPAAYRIEWDDYETLIVVGEGGGIVRPAWVVTFATTDLVTPVVGYRATAYIDQAGNVQIDARNAIIVGPQKSGWSPDSFAIAADGSVFTLDDRNDANMGTVSGKTDAKEQDKEFQRLRVLAEVLISGCI